jgi:hypothetical protein
MDAPYCQASFSVLVYMAEVVPAFKQQLASREDDVHVVNGASGKH